MIGFLCLIFGVIVLFVLWCAFVAVSKFRRAARTAALLKPEAAQQFLFWDTHADRASALGEKTVAKICKAKALVVVATNCPISELTNGSLPLMCQPGYIENLSASELDELIQVLGKANLAKSVTRRNLDKAR